MEKRLLIVVGTLSCGLALGQDNSAREITYKTIGTTKYDWQTNYTNSNRIVVNDNGTIGMVYIRSTDSKPFLERGTGYNYFYGSSWGAESTARIEDERWGWPLRIWF